MTSERLDLPQGTLELLILKGLTRGRQHGYALARWIESRSEGHILVEEGSLYPAVHRMERRGWIAAAWDRTPKGRRARFYTLTDSGRRELAARKKRWCRLVEAVGGVLRSRGVGETIPRKRPKTSDAAKGTA